MFYFQLTTFFTSLSLSFLCFLKPCMLSHRTTLSAIQRPPYSIPHLFLIHRNVSSSLCLGACHIPAYYNSYSSFCALSLHQSTFYSLWLSAMKGSPLPHPGTPRAPEAHRTAPTNQNAANTAPELFTGSGQQAFCIRLL